jgi:hypothetical protein
MTTTQQLKPIDHGQDVAMRPQAITPMEMLNTAVERGAGIDVLERLMTLQERYEANQAKKAYSAAMADAKAEIKPIVKNRKVDFTSQKGRTNYDYEDLAGIADVIDPILSKFGLSYRWRSKQDGSKLTIICIMTHRDGYSEEAAELSAENDNSGNKNSIQAVGSTATFLQRYTLKLAVGLAATKDDDGKAADPDEKISENQLTELLDLSEKLGVDKIKFCEWAKIEAFSEIRRTEFQKAKNAILAKGKQAAKKDAEA